MSTGIHSTRNGKSAFDKRITKKWGAKTNSEKHTLSWNNWFIDVPGPMRQTSYRVRSVQAFAIFFQPRMETLDWGKEDPQVFEGYHRILLVLQQRRAQTYNMERSRLAQRSRRQALIQWNGRRNREKHYGMESLKAKVHIDINHGSRVRGSVKCCQGSCIHRQPSSSENWGSTM